MTYEKRHHIYRKRTDNSREFPWAPSVHPHPVIFLGPILSYGNEKWNGNDLLEWEIMELLLSVKFD